MKLLIIGASGKLGEILCSEGKSRGHYICAAVRREYTGPKVDEVLIKDLFDITKDDVKGYDGIVSAFGGGINVDPTINRKAINHLASLVMGTGMYLVLVGGAGSLYTDSRHATLVYETKEHPEVLREISKNIYKGYLDLKEMWNVNYCFVCPSLSFEYMRNKQGIYQVGTEGEVIFSSKGESRVSYKDFATAMIDEVENRRYDNKLITICEV